MNYGEKLSLAYAESKTYPELVKKLVALGVQNYTVDVTTGITLMRFADGKHFIKRDHLTHREIVAAFDHGATKKAVMDTQQGKTSYPQFMDDMARAGVRFYEATLTGKKRVTYIGAQGEYEEEIPL